MKKIEGDSAPKMKGIDKCQQCTHYDANDRNTELKGRKCGTCWIDGMITFGTDWCASFKRHK